MSIVSELIHAHKNLALFEANEAETRLKLIDRILLEVLGWTRDDISVEERVLEDGNTTYADYIVRTAGSAFVIEAKKVGVTFRDVPNVRRHRLSGALMHGETGSAIIQARDYCRKKGIQFAVVTNGAQWIVYPAARVDQVSFAESAAVIFPSLESALSTDYSDFSHLLSRDDVIAGSLETELLGRSEDQLGERRLKNFFTNRGSAPARNPLYPLIEGATITAFTDSIVDSSPELLEKCYVQTAARIRFDQRINMYIQRPLPVFGRQPIRPMQRKDADDLRQTIELVQATARPVAILVVGTVGAGKTTFLHYTRALSSASFFQKGEGGPYPHWIYVDFRDFRQSDNVSHFIYHAIRTYISTDWFLSNYEQCIRPAYIDPIRALRDGPLKPLSGNEDKINERIADYLLKQSETDDYIDRLLCYAATKAPIFIVVDNVDQIEQIDLQSSIFAEAMTLTHKSRLNLIISLRDATFVRHRSTPTFDAFDFVPINIDPPAILAVLSRRFFLVRQLLAGKSGSFVAENGAKVEVGDLSIIADLIQSSVLGTNIGKIIDILATSDVRLALRMTREFLESGYSNPGRAISIYKSTGTYTLPRHEALRSVLLGNHPVYAEQYSILGNPFDARFSRTNHQVLRLFVLTALVMMSSRPDFRYAEGADIRTALREVGFGDQATKKVLADLCECRFIFTGGHDDPELGSSFYPSRLGGYIIRYLIADLVFIEAMMMDTFIASSATWEELRDTSEAVDAERDVIKRLVLRQRRIMVFFNYMHGQYRILLDEARRRALSQEWCEDPFETIRRRLQRNMKVAISSAKKYY